MDENQRDPVGLNWRVSLIFSVDLNKIDLTPGSGQLPEEIVLHLNNCPFCDNVSLTPLSETESNRQYLVTAMVRMPESSAAIYLLRHKFSPIPSCRITRASATIAERIE